VSVACGIPRIVAGGPQRVQCAKRQRGRGRGWRKRFATSADAFVCLRWLQDDKTEKKLKKDKKVRWLASWL